jgi:hypothetical protein
MKEAKRMNGAGDREHASSMLIVFEINRIKSFLFESYNFILSSDWSDLLHMKVGLTTLRLLTSFRSLR